MCDCVIISTIIVMFQICNSLSRSLSFSHVFRMSMLNDYLTKKNIRKQ